MTTFPHNSEESRKTESGGSMSRGVICDAVASNHPLAVSFPVFLVSLDSLFLMFLTSQTPTCFFGEAEKLRRSYIGDEASENAVLQDLRLWLRHKRSQAFHQDEIRRRRAAIKSVQDQPDLGKP